MFTISMSDFHPKSSIVAVTSSLRSVVVKYTTFSSRTPAPANCFAASSVPEPGGPVIRTVYPLGSPFIRALSSAAIPVEATFGTSALRLDLQGLVAHEVQHVADLVGFVLLHGEDDRVRLLRAEVVHKDVEELAQDLRVVVNREAVDRVDNHEILSVLRLPNQVLDLQHEVLEHCRALDIHRVLVLVARGHHDLGDAVDEPDVAEADLKDLEGVDDRRGGDRGGDVDRIEGLLRREYVEQRADHVEVVLRLHPQRHGRRLGERVELLAHLRRHRHRQPPVVAMLPPFRRGTRRTPTVVRSRTYFARECIVPRIFTACRVRRRSPRRSRLPVTMTPSAIASSTPNWEYRSSVGLISETRRVVHPLELSIDPSLRMKSRMFSCVFSR